MENRKDYTYQHEGCEMSLIHAVILHVVLLLLRHITFGNCCSVREKWQWQKRGKTQHWKNVSYEEGVITG